MNTFASNYGSASQSFIMKFYYVYILQSENTPERIYTGFTKNLESRLNSHNRGENPHTAKYRPWRIKTAVAFMDRQKALDFEIYLKSPSGRVFSKKRL
jgi:putative endonuclease